MPRETVGDIAEQPLDDADRQAVRLDAVGCRERLQGGHRVPLTTDHAPHKAFTGQQIQAMVAAVPLGRRIHDGQVVRLAVVGEGIRQSRGQTIA